jgi:hypothetical protein
MLHASGKYSCDREVGSVKRGWHSCNKKAQYEVCKYMGNSLIVLHFCGEDHMKASAADTVPSIRTVSEKKLESVIYRT